MLYKPVYNVMSVSSVQSSVNPAMPSCSSADEDDLDPDTKAARERERRQANNVRERCGTRGGLFVQGVW